MLIKTIDKLVVKIADNRKELGQIAAKEVADKIISLLEEKEEISIIFASAPSQNEFLYHLKQDKRINWSKVRAFNMDEYIQLDIDAPQGFGNFLRKNLYNDIPLKEIYLFDSETNDTEYECQRYAELLEKYQPDICIYGVGENGHLAFNDPPVADFYDKEIVKVVELDSICRHQQVNDGCFKELVYVPTHAYTLTIPTLVKVPYLFGMVPGNTKTKAITHMLMDKISTACPASILRTHENAILYVDQDSAKNIL